MLSAETTDVRALLAENGVALGANVPPQVLVAAQAYRGMTATGAMARTLATLLFALAGFAWAYSRTTQDFRARNTVETTIMGLLIAASSIAIATTAGIVSVDAVRDRNFFGQYDWTDFFFSATWSPQFQGNSDLGILPLLWGTLYISFIALAFAVPVGLFAAIYMSEYAGQALARRRQADDRDFGRYPHHRLRPVRADHRRPDAARLLRATAWALAAAGHR